MYWNGHVKRQVGADSIQNINTKKTVNNSLILTLSIYCPLSFSTFISDRGPLCGGWWQHLHQPLCGAPGLTSSGILWEVGMGIHLFIIPSHKMQQFVFLTPHCTVPNYTNIFIFIQSFCIPYPHVGRKWK